jgi:hypothetical protein
MIASKDTFIRKVKIAYYTGRLAYLRCVMDREEGITPKWKQIAREHAGLARRRSDLLTPAEIRKIEKRRGLA